MPARTVGGLVAFFLAPPAVQFEEAKTDLTAAATPAAAAGLRDLKAWVCNCTSAQLVSFQTNMFITQAYASRTCCNDQL